MFFEIHKIIYINSLLALKFIRNSSDVSVDMDEMRTEFNAQQQGATDPSGATESYTMMRLFRSKELHMPLLITVMLQVIQQLSGINAVRIISYHCEYSISSNVTQIFYPF